MSMQSAPGIYLTMQCVYRPVDRIAGALAAGVLIADGVFRFPVPEFLQHLPHGRREYSACAHDSRSACMRV